VLYHDVGLLRQLLQCGTHLVLIDRGFVLSCIGKMLEVEVLTVVHEVLALRVHD